MAPVGHLLRPALSDNWTRFHSLPQSKRYASNGNEYTEILQRHLAVASDIFEAEEPIYIYKSNLRTGRLSEKQRVSLAGHQLREKVLTLPLEHAPDEDAYCVRSLVTCWPPDFFEVLNKQIADWIETGVAFVSPRTKNIYCPYDGGMDIFSFSKPASTLENKFSSWMSIREDRM